MGTMCAAKQPVPHNFFCAGFVDLMAAMLGYTSKQSQTLSE